MADLTCLTVATPVNAPVQNHATPNPGTNRVVEKVLSPSTRAEDELTEGAQVRVVVSHCRDVKGLFNESRQRNVIPARYVGRIHDPLTLEIHGPPESDPAPGKAELVFQCAGLSQDRLDHPPSAPRRVGLSTDDLHDVSIRTPDSQSILCAANVNRQN